MDSSPQGAALGSSEVHPTVFLKDKDASTGKKNSEEGSIASLSGSIILV
jgi:hypothetical protein